MKAIREIISIVITLIIIFLMNLRDLTSPPFYVYIFNIIISIISNNIVFSLLFLDINTFY